MKSLPFRVTIGLCAAFLLSGSAIGFLGANYLNRAAETRPDGTTQQPVQAAQAQPLTQNGTMQDVAKVIETAKANPGDFEAQMEAAGMYAQIQRFEKAVEFLDTAAKLNGLNVEQSIRLGNALFDARQFDKARLLYVRALKERPDDADLRSDLGATYRDGSAPDFPSALREFETVLTKDPKHEPTLYNLGLTFLKMGERTKAEAVLKRLESAAPGNELGARLKKELEGI